MIGGWMPWRRLLPVWLPAVLLCLASFSIYVWQSSGSGREAQLAERVTELEASLVRLEQAGRDAEADSAAVTALDSELQRVYNEVFGSLDSRLTDILREAEAATRGAGMLPERLSYRHALDDSLECVRFTITFSVAGPYASLRRMLAAIQSSPEFLIVERIAFRGEAEPTSNEIQIAINLSTFFAEADPNTLRLLTGQVAGGRVEEASASPSQDSPTDLTEGGPDGE